MHCIILYSTNLNNHSDMEVTVGSEPEKGNPHILTLGCKEMKTINGIVVYIQTGKVITLPVSGSGLTMRYMNSITDFLPTILIFNILCYLKAVEMSQSFRE